MDSREFLKYILPNPLPPIDITQGIAPTYFILGLGGARPVQRVAPTLDDVYRLCNELSAQGLDAYMALAGFKNSAGRTAANALWFRCLWADIDVGKPDTIYQTQAEALGALANFADATGLKPTFVVSSGMGLHVYWCLTRNIEAAVWADFSARLAQSFREHRLAVDNVCTQDKARILRLPGTVHTKTGNRVAIILDNSKKRIYAPQGLDRRLPPAVPAPTVHAAPSLAQKAALAAMGMTFDGPKANAKDVSCRCRQVAQMGEAPYPAWQGAVSVLKACEGGYEEARRLSEGASKWDEVAFERVYASVRDDAPTCCVTFNNVNPGVCDTCALWGVVKSPIASTRHPIPFDMVQSAPVAEPAERNDVAPTFDIPAPEIATENANTEQIVQALPAELRPKYQPLTFHSSDNCGFIVNDKGIFQTTNETDAATGLPKVKTTLVTEAQLYYKYSTFINESGEAHRTFMFEVIHPDGRREDLLFDPDADLVGGNVSKWFTNGGIFSLWANERTWRSLMNAYLTLVSRKAPELPTYKTYGWHEYTSRELKDTKVPAFVIGRGAITDKGLQPHSLDSSIAETAAQELKCTGSLEKWKEVPRLYKTLDQKIGQLAMCMSFAAPFMRWGVGDGTNGILSLWSNKGGKGKTQVLKAAASVWGHPELQFVDREATKAARVHKLKLSNNLPVYMDEMTDKSSADLYGLAYTLAGGREYDKMHMGGERAQNKGGWHTITFTTSNKPYKAAISQAAGDSDATLLRVIEYECDFADYSNDPERRSYIMHCMATRDNNYGLAGPEFMYWVMQRQERLDGLNAMLRHWITMHSYRDDERYISCPCGLAIIIGRWAVEAGLLDYDMDALEEWVTTTLLDHNRKMTREWGHDASQSIMNFLMDYQSGLLITKSLVRPATSVAMHTRGVPDDFILSEPMRDVAMRLCCEERELVIPKHLLVSWCSKHNTTLPVLVRNLEEYGVRMVERPVNFGSGISWLGVGQLPCYVMDAAVIERLGLYVPEIRQVEKNPKVAFQGGAQWTN